MEALPDTGPVYQVDVDLGLYDETYESHDELEEAGGSDSDADTGGLHVSGMAVPSFGDDSENLSYGLKECPLSLDSSRNETPRQAQPEARFYGKEKFLSEAIVARHVAARLPETSLRTQILRFTALCETGRPGTRPELDPDRESAVEEIFYRLLSGDEITPDQTYRPALQFCCGVWGIKYEDSRSWTRKVLVEALENWVCRSSFGGENSSSSICGLGEA